MSYRLRSFIEYPPVQKPKSGALGYYYPPPPSMQSYEVYHQKPPLIIKKEKKKTRSKRSLSNDWEKRSTKKAKKSIVSSTQHDKSASSSNKLGATTTSSEKYDTEPKDKTRLKRSPSKHDTNARKTRTLPKQKASTKAQKCLDPELLKGVCMRSTGKWQAQLYFQGKSRYIGCFDSQEAAALACSIARDELEAFCDTSMDKNTVKRKVNEARQVASASVAETIVHDKTKMSSVSKPKKTATAATKKAPEQEKKSNKAKTSTKKNLDKKPDTPKKTKTPAKAAKSKTCDKDTPLDTEILRGVTMRESKRWQAQLYYQGKSRYIGVFKTKEIAALAFEIARGILKPTTQDALDHRAIEQNVVKAREAAFAEVKKKLPKS